jgi:xanthine dehydrogenase YagS FAD-binding subunit
MHPFSYSQAANESDAVKTVSQAQNAKFLAGGTTLIDLMKLHVEQPDVIVDVNPLPLSDITILPDGGVRIGAMVRNSDCANSDIIKQQYPVLSQAILAGASAQLRNMATTGGNILQRTRCYYFRDTSQPCNKREPGTGCAAIEGFNRVHAVLGTSSHCIASHPSDMCVAISALDAVIVTSGKKGERRIPINDFYLLPGNHPERENVLEHGELITAVELPPIPYAKNSHYIKVRDRASYAFAMVSAAVALDIQNSQIAHVRIAMGGVGTKPWRAYDAEKHLIGKAPNTQLYREAAEIALNGAKPYSDNAFKIELAKRTVVRALRHVYES